MLANMKYFLYLCSVKEIITTYEAIKRQKLANQWSTSLAMFPKAFTLDIYYHIYQAVEEYEPERSYGYRKRICTNSQICSDLWGGVSKERNAVIGGSAERRNEGNGVKSIGLGYDRMDQHNRLGKNYSYSRTNSGSGGRNNPAW